jgi:MinD-like ATPase involved in chromosome partitioning or flagellar assembly
MKVALLFKDERLLANVLPSPSAPGEEWESFNDLSEWRRGASERTFTHIVVSDRLADYEELLDVLEAIKERMPGTKLLVLLSNHNQTSLNEKYLKMCLSLKCEWVPPGRSVPAVAEHIWHFVYGRRKEERNALSGKLITFIGSTPNIGTTVASFGTAWHLAKSTNDTVGYICLNLKSSKLHRYIGRDERVTSLDHLRAELKSRSLHKERLRQYCEPLGEAANLYVLYGNMLREQAEFFTADEIEHLLNVARSAFDVCIIEVNAYWDNAATVCGVLHADTRILVTTNEITHFQEDVGKWLKTIGAVFGIQPHSFDLLLTKGDKRSASGGIRTKDVRKETQMHVIGEIGCYPPIIEYLNQGKLLDLLQEPCTIQADLSRIAQVLIRLYGLRHKEHSIRRPWLKRILSGTAAV